MNPHQSNSKITQHHLERKAIVYLRQSSERQVLENKESTRLQYALKERAHDLGWENVEVIDRDLGLSAGFGAASREGFKQIVANIALGEVGILFCREASRLSRTDKDWCHLMEMCRIFNTLIGDAQTVYDINLMDDQLILGIKGTLSVVELNILKARMLEGMKEKAKRGELVKLLTPGYVHDSENRVVKDPNKRVQDAIQLVFRKFREIRSVRQTYLWFHNHDIKLPVNKSRNGHMQIVWQLPTSSFIRNVLKNAFYAGVYVWGQRLTKVVFKNGRISKRTCATKNAEECEVCIKDHHEGYIDWKTYQENLEMIESNSFRFGNGKAPAVPRSGQGFLSGLLRCNRCGRKLYVYYNGKSKTGCRYICKGDREPGSQYCIGFGGSAVDKRFSDELLKVITPFGMRASLKAIDTFKRRDEAQMQALGKQHQQLQYEAKRAFEQYNEVDPRNRLVAEELEKRWNEKLKKTEELKAIIAEKKKQVPELTEEDRETILELGNNFKFVWESVDCQLELKKKIIRTLVEEIIADVNKENNILSFIVHWKGGVHTEFTMPRPLPAVEQKTAIEDLEIIRKMAVHHNDSQIASTLNRLGRRTARGKRWNKLRVNGIRQCNNIAAASRGKQSEKIISLAAAAKYYNVSHHTIKRLVVNGLLKKQQVCPRAPWEIKQSDLESEEIQNIIAHLKKTGKLLLKGGHRVEPESFFLENGPKSRK